VVNEVFDWNTGRKFRETADMIRVVVTDNQVIDLVEAGVMDGGHNSFRVTDGAWSAVSGIDQHRFSGR
jgi:hypothetical protein